MLLRIWVLGLKWIRDRVVKALSWGTKGRWFDPSQDILTFNL